MKINNKEYAKKIRRLFYWASVSLISLIAVLFLLDYFKWGIIAAILSSLYIIFFLTAEYLYVEFDSAGDEISIKYGKVITFGTQDFSSIVFPKQLYHSATFEDSFMGRLTDMTITVRTQRGLADYPAVSLSAMPLEYREQIQAELKKLEH